MGDLGRVPGAGTGQGCFPGCGKGSYARESARGWKRIVQPGLHFWRDAAGHEVDFLVELGTRRVPVEAKSAQTLADDFLDGIQYWQALCRQPEGPAALVYGGDKAFKRSGVAVVPWFAV